MRILLACHLLLLAPMLRVLTLSVARKLLPFIQVGCTALWFAALFSELRTDLTSDSAFVFWTFVLAPAVCLGLSILIAFDFVRGGNLRFESAWGAVFLGLSPMAIWGPLCLGRYPSQNWWPETVGIWLIASLPT